MITRKSNDGDIFDIEDILKPKNNAANPGSSHKEVVTPRCRSKSRERRISSAKLYNGLRLFTNFFINFIKKSEAKMTTMNAQNSENLKIKTKKFDVSSTSGKFERS